MKNQESIVIHDHKALIGHHFDLRITIDNVVKTWVSFKKIIFPFIKPISLFEGTLHPMEIMDFEGNINDGRFGSGKMEILHKTNILVVHYTKGEEVLCFILGKYSYQLQQLQTDRRDEWLLIPILNN